MKQAEIKIVLVGTEGQLDKLECEFAVKHLGDHKEAIGVFLKEMELVYPNLGWTLLTGHKPIDKKCEPC